MNLHLFTRDHPNGTRYELAIARLTPAESVGWSGAPNGGIFVGWRGMGAGLLAPEGVLAANYVGEKLSVRSPCDQSAITEIICELYPERTPMLNCPCGEHQEATR